MAISIDPATYIISVPQSFLTFVGGVSYQLNTDLFRLSLRDWEDNEEGIYQPKTHNHNTTVLLGGIQYSRVIEILSPYTITFEETGTPYSVALVGSNNNILEKTNLGTVQVLSNNSAGLINVAETQFGAFDNGVTLDTANISGRAMAGTSYPAGTGSAPSNNLTDALDIATARGFNTLYVLGDLTIGATPTVDSIIFVGRGMKNTTITIDGATATKCVFKNSKVTGSFANGASGSQADFNNCNISDLENISLDAFHCVLSGTIRLITGSFHTNFYNCVDGVHGTGTVIIEVNACDKLGIWNYSGGIKLTNIITAGTLISFNAPTGMLIVDSTDTQGTIIARGVGSISGTTGGTIISQTDLLSRDTISHSIWEELTADHTTAGTTGKALSDAGAAGNPWGSPVEGNMAIGTFGELVGKKLLTVAKFLGLK